MRGRRECGEPGTGWATATRAQKAAWTLRILTKCQHDGLFKSRPSSVCAVCGLDPTRYTGQHPSELDRELGWDWIA